MIDLKCASMYGIIGGMREHDIIVRKVVAREVRCKCFGITPNRITSPCGNFEVVVPAEALLFLTYRPCVCTAWGIPQIRHCHTQHRTLDFTTLTLRHSTLKISSPHSHFPPTLTFAVHTHLFAITFTHVAEISTPSLAMGDDHVTRNWVACMKSYKVQ